jgi:hypothetical protein
MRRSKERREREEGGLRMEKVYTVSLAYVGTHSAVQLSHP